MQPTTNWRGLAHALSQATARHAPAWTDSPDGDPGVTLLELFAFLGERLLGDGVLTDEHRSAAARLQQVLERYQRATPEADGPGAMTCWSGQTRPRFFAGQLPTAEQFTAEQEYLLGTHRLHVRALHGVGIVAGLDVQVSTGGEVSVGPGHALDPLGRDLLVSCPVSVALPSGADDAVAVVVEYAERAVRPVAGAAGPDGVAVLEATAVEEGCRIRLAAATDTGVTVARLVRGESGWQLDTIFEPARAH